MYGIDFSLRILSRLMLGLGVLVWLMAAPLWASPEMSSDSDHKGIVSFGAYQVFPENRVDNAVYLNNRMVLSLPGQSIRYLLPLIKEGRFAYLATSETGERELGIYLPPTDPSPRVKGVAPGIYHAVIVMDGVVYKKIYRVLQNSVIVDLLPASKTADGLAVSSNGVLFFHVASASSSKVNGKRVSEFALRLHLVLFEEERLRHLDYPIINALPQLVLGWEDETTIKYTLSDGRTDTLSIAQFQ